MKNRIIKFRAWDFDNKSWFTPRIEDGIATVEVRHLEVEGHFGTHTEEYPRKYEINQFTGLHDKNGKEIYERDIIHNCKWNIDNNSNAVVEWDKIGWNCDYNFMTKGEIIGNIYESPDLLMSKKMKEVLCKCDRCGRIKPLFQYTKFETQIVKIIKIIEMGKHRTEYKDLGEKRGLCEECSVEVNKKLFDCKLF